MEIVHTESVAETEFYPYGEKQPVALLDCEFSPDGSAMAVSGMHPEIVVFSIPSMTEAARNFQSHAPVVTQRLKGHGKPVTSVEWQSETAMISGSADSTVGCFDVSTGQRVRKYRGHEGIVNCVRTIDGNLFSSVGDDGWLRIWDARTGARQGAVKSFEHKFPITSLAAQESLGIAKVWFGTLDNEVLEFDVVSGRARKLASLNDGVCSLALNEDCTNIFARTFTGQIWRCSLARGDVTPLTAGRPNYRQKHLNRMTSTIHDGIDCCLTGEEDGDMCIVVGGSAGASSHKTKRHSAGSTVAAVSVHRPSGSLATCASDGTLRLGNLSF